MHGHGSQRVAPATCGHVWVARDDGEDDEFEVIFVKSSSSVSEQMVLSVKAVAGWKPRVVDRLRLASTNYYYYYYYY